MMKKRTALFVMIALLISAHTNYAQLNRVFSDIWKQVLVDDLILSPGEHGGHFIPAAMEADQVLSRSLNGLITHNLASFPLTATVAGKTYDFSTGQPVPISGSLGPIYAETARTLGSGKVSFGINYSYLDLTKFRGIRTEDIRFTFVHDDVVGDGAPLGDLDQGEADVVDFTLGMDLNATIFAFAITFGITNRFDMGLVIPAIDINMSGEAIAALDGPSAELLHKFPVGNRAEAVPYRESATGIGDIGLRLKYNFVPGGAANFGALLDIRFPTGREEDFLGTGEITTKLSLIWSKKLGDFTPHLNVGFDRRPKSLDSDEFEFIAGFDQKVADGITLAMEFLAEFDVDTEDEIRFFSTETRTITATNSQGAVVGEKIVDLTNMPGNQKDHTLNAAFGFRAAPSDHLLFLGNLLVALNSGGLRSRLIPTMGVTLSF